MKIKKVNIQDVLASFKDHWNPHIIGELNGQQVKAAKLKGEFVFHHHENEDEMFMVLSGDLKMALEDEIIDVKSGEFIIIPKGVSHKPIAEKEVSLLLFEPATTLNTGNVTNEFTKKKLKRL